MPRLILLRHGQSQWNLENRFTGWVDVDLTAEGEAQARQAGERMAEASFKPAVMFTSVLLRAKRTGAIALQSAGLNDVPVVADWRLNERHYGGLTGLDKAETTRIHGEDQVRIWRRSYDIPPPPLAAGSEWAFAGDPRYAGHAIPDTESLKTTLERVLPYWNEAIAPRLAAGDDVLIAAHGNSLRAIVKHLFAVPDDRIVRVEIPTGNPLEIELDASLKPTSARYLEGDRAQPLPVIAA